MRNSNLERIIRTMKRLVPFAFVMVFGACAQAQEVRGTVFEIQNPEAPRAEWKRAPLAGAFVIAHWTGQRPGLAHYESVCIQAAIGRTDAQGRYEIAEPPPLRSTFLVWRHDPSVAVYKPGFDDRYELRVDRPRREHSLAPTRLDAAQRASLAEAVSRLGCDDSKGGLLPLTDPQGVLPAFREALAAEVPRKPQGVEIRVLPASGPRPAAP